MSEQQRQSQSEQELKGLHLDIQYNVRPDTPTFYSNNVVIQFSEYEAYLVFFETPPPLAIGTPEEWPS
jgi:hypothetical protein